jgi:hypothetical protein
MIQFVSRSEEGDKELEKERERITPFITFQQVTTTTTSTNMSSIAGSSAQSSSQGSSTNALPDNLQSSSSLPITTKIVQTTMKMTKLSNSKCSSLLPSSSSTSQSLTMAPISSPIGGNGVIIEELPPDDPSCSSDSLLSVATSDLGVPSDWQMVNGNGIKSMNQNSLKLMGHTNNSMISSPPPSSSSDMSLIDLTDSYISDHNGGSPIHHQPPTSTILTSTIKSSDSQVIAENAGNLLPRLKRSFAEVEDLVVTSNAKRPLVPAAFITSYTPLHHSSHLGSKWGTETTTTILFDQHNNNG